MGPSLKDIGNLERYLQKHFNFEDLGSSVHISDTHNEAIIVGEMSLNANSVFFMNHHNGMTCEHVSLEIAQRKRLHEINPKSYLHSQSIMIDSGAVMSFFGLRKLNDIDLLFESEIEVNLLGERNGLFVDAHAFNTNCRSPLERAFGKYHITPDRTIADLFSSDPQNYFRYRFN